MIGGSATGGLYGIYSEGPLEEVNIIGAKIRGGLQDVKLAGVKKFFAKGNDLS